MVSPQRERGRNQGVTSAGETRTETGAVDTRVLLLSPKSDGGIPVTLSTSSTCGDTGRGHGGGSPRPPRPRHVCPGASAPCFPVSSGVSHPPVPVPHIPGVLVGAEAAAGAVPGAAGDAGVRRRETANGTKMALRQAGRASTRRDVVGTLGRAQVLKGFGGEGGQLRVLAAPQSPHDSWGDHPAALSHPGAWKHPETAPKGAASTPKLHLRLIRTASNPPEIV